MTRLTLETSDDIDQLYILTRFCYSLIIFCHSGAGRGNVKYDQIILVSASHLPSSKYLII